MILRNCPWCDTNKSQLLFHYNYDYLMKINNSDKILLDMIGFKKNDKASLVKCNECTDILFYDYFSIVKTLIMPFYRYLISVFRFKVKAEPIHKVWMKVN